MRIDKSTISKIVLILLWGVGCFVFFQTQFKYHLFYEEQNQLFLWDWEYIGQYFSQPAWAACLVGDFLTQFYYYLYAGAFILTGVLLVYGDLLRRDLEKILTKWKFLPFSVSTASWVATLVALIIITVHARLCLDENYRLSSLICPCGGAAMWFAHNTMGNWLRNWWKRALVLIPTLILTYWLFGEMGLLVMGAFEILGGSVIGIVYVPALTAGIAFVGAPYTCRPFSFYPGNGKWVDYEEAKRAELNLMLDNEYYFGNYAKVVELYEQHKDQVSDIMSFFYSLALAQMGSLPEKMVTMEKPYLGTFEKIGENTPMYTIKMIHDLYWAIGDMTYTERAALLANTFSRNGRNARMIKRLAEANLVNNDTRAATKYLRLLEKTLVYRQWAKDHTPGQFSAPVKMEIEKKQQFVNTTNSIRLGDSCYTILTQLLDSNPENLIALNYLLCSDMLSGERETFIMDFEKYDGGRVPFFQQIYNSAKQ